MVLPGRGYLQPDVLVLLMSEGTSRPWVSQALASQQCSAVRMARRAILGEFKLERGMARRAALGEFKLERAAERYV